MKERVYIMGTEKAQAVIEGMNDLQKYLNSYTSISEGFKESIMFIAEKIKNESYEIGKLNPTNFKRPELGLKSCEDCGNFEKSMDYVVKDEIWNKVNGGKDYLCLECLEKRLGRKLQYSDFDLDLPINAIIEYFNYYIKNLAEVFAEIIDRG